MVDTVRSAYDAFVGSGGPVKEVAAAESRRKQEHLREVNDEIMHLRNRGMSGGGLSDQERRRWQELREEREELRGALQQVKEVKAAEKILDSESVLQKVEVDLETTHVLQYNAFADTLGKKVHMRSADEVAVEARPKCGGSKRTSIGVALGGTCQWAKARLAIARSPCSARTTRS